MTSDYRIAKHLLPQETRFQQCLSVPRTMRCYAPALFLVIVAATLITSQLTFRTEENEFTILISATSAPIDTVLTHIHQLRKIIDGIKSIKATKKIFNSLSKANRIKEKYELIVGSQRHSSRGIMDSITETSGLIIGRIFGLASAKQEKQLSSAINDIR